MTSIRRGFRSVPLGQTAPGRRGFTLAETTISALLLSAIFVTVLPTMGWVVRTRRAAERHQTALLAAGNLMERLTVLPYEELTPERAAEFDFPESVMKQLPEAQLHVTVQPVPDDSFGKQISIDVRWPESSPGTWSAPVRLSAWVYSQTGRGT